MIYIHVLGPNVWIQFPKDHPRGPSEGTKFGSECFQEPRTKKTYNQYDGLQTVGHCRSWEHSFEVIGSQ